MRCADYRTTVFAGLCSAILGLTVEHLCYAASLPAVQRELLKYEDKERSNTTAHSARKHTATGSTTTQRDCGAITASYISTPL